MVAQSPEPEAYVLNVRAFRIELEFRSVGFCGEGKPEYLEKNLSAQRRELTANSTQYDLYSGNPTQATLVEGVRSHHYAFPVPLASYWLIHFYRISPMKQVSTMKQVSARSQKKITT